MSLSDAPVFTIETAARRCDPHPETEVQQPTPVEQLAQLLIDIKDLAALLSRSVPSLHRDDAAGRLPAALWIGGSKRWRYSEIAAWVEAGCPSRVEWEAMNRSRR